MNGKIRVVAVGVARENPPTPAVKPGNSKPDNSKPVAPVEVKK